MKRPSAHATVSESGDFLRLILRSNRIGLWSVELETGKVSWSSEILDILGRTQEELGDTDDGLFSSIHEDDRPDVIAAIERAVATGESFGVAFRILHPDGGFRWIDARGCVIRNSEGMATQLHVIGIDITERRRFATEAIEAAERLRAIVDTAVDGIVTVTSKGIIESINPATLRIFGYDATELIGQNVNMLMPEPYHSRHDKYIANYEQTRQARIIGIGRKVVGRRKSGVTFPMDLAVSEFQTSGGRMYTGLIRDVTEREQSEQEIRNLNMTLEMRVTARTAELQELNRELEGFCYSIAHDLRQRLRNVSTISALLSADHGDQFHQEAAELLVTLNASARGVSMLVNDLLAYTRIGRQAVERVPVNLSNLARASCSELQNSEWPCRSLTFRIEENLIADGDPQLLRLVLDNLLENACKYSRRHSAQTIQVGSKLIRGEQAFIVKDRGVGFPVEFAHKLFQPFERLHAQTEYAGNGIGLANVKRIVEKHGGNVWARANRGYGATFFFTLGQSEGVERGG